MIKDLVVLKREDIPEIQELFEAVYPERKEDETYWEWMFDSPLHYHPMGLKIRDIGLVSYHAYIGSMSSSAMVHPDYRGKGCWSPLAKFCFTEMDKIGNDFLYLFSNEKIHKIHTHHGFEDLLQIKEYRIPIEDIEIDFGWGYYPKEYLPDSIEEWRYKKHPLNTYINYTNAIDNDKVIFSEYKNRIQIIDYSNLKRALGIAVHIGSLLNKDIISFWSQKELDYPYEIIPTWLMIKDLRMDNNWDVLKERLKEHNWQMGDSDVY